MYQTIVQDRSGRVQNGCMRIRIEPLQPLIDKQKEREEAKFYKGIAKSRLQKNIENHDKKQLSYTRMQSLPRTVE
jgi:hypothetical protein